MKKKILLFGFLFIFSLFLGIKSVYAEEVSLSVFPAAILQGDPFLVQVNGVTKISEIKKLFFVGKKINIFMYQGKPSALVAIDLNKKPGDYELKVEMKSGEIVKSIVSIGKRDIVEEPLGIPEKLGGNTTASQDKLVATLIADKKSVTGLRTNSKALWTAQFIPPLRQTFVTSPYGYSRKTGVYSIPHKGVDYRAFEGTEVMAINRGVVRIAQSYRNYGKSIYIDHGLGLVSYYLHLSKYKVKVGDVVERGQVIGLSGHTGYTLGAHLHLGIKINEITIDPIKFFELFK